MALTTTDNSRIHIPSSTAPQNHIPNVYLITLLDIKSKRHSLLCSFWDSEIYMRCIGGHHETNICDGWGWRKQHAKVRDAELLIQLKQKPLLILQGVLGLERTLRIVPVEARDIRTLSETVIRCRLPPERGITLGKAASSYQEQFLERTQLWAPAVNTHDSWEMSTWSWRGIWVAQLLL